MYLWSNLICMLLEFRLSVRSQQINLNFLYAKPAFSPSLLSFWFWMKHFLFCCTCQASRTDCSFVAFYCLDTAGLFISESILSAKVISNFFYFFEKTSLQKQEWFEGIAFENIWVFPQRVCLTEKLRVLDS